MIRGIRTTSVQVVGFIWPLGVELPGFGNQFIFGYEVEVELPIQLENGNEVEYE